MKEEVSKRFIYCGPDIVCCKECAVLELTTNIIEDLVRTGARESCRVWQSV
jgi:hypothetical protein